MLAAASSVRRFCDGDHTVAVTLVTTNKPSSWFVLPGSTVRGYLPNGAGKSTIRRIVMGLVGPDIE
jgi:ABC-type transport system involved in cytochrome c biogenesis ATPase subunit